MNQNDCDYQYVKSDPSFAFVPFKSHAERVRDVFEIEKVADRVRARTGPATAFSGGTFFRRIRPFRDTKQTVKQRQQVQRRGHVVHPVEPDFLEQDTRQCRADRPSCSEKQTHETDPDGPIFFLKTHGNISIRVAFTGKRSVA